MDVPITDGYTKVSELLRDMPSNQELSKLSAAQGYIVGIGDRRTLTNGDLLLLQRKAAGQRDSDIAREFGVRRGSIHRRLVWIRYILQQKLKIQIDMPELFPYKG